MLSSSDFTFELYLGAWNVWVPQLHRGTPIGRVDGIVRESSGRAYWVAWAPNGQKVINKAGKEQHFPSRAAAARALSDLLP